MMNNNVRIKQLSLVNTEIFTRIKDNLRYFVQGQIFRETEHIFFFALICIAISRDLARFFDDDGPEIEFKDKNEDGKNTKYFG